LHGVGNCEISHSSSLGLICSVQCPGCIVIKTFDAIRELRDAGIVVAGGFHSPMERECLDFLLRGEQLIIVCSAKGLGQPRLPATWRTAIDAGRLLLVTPFADSVRRTTKAQAQTRNEFVAAMSTAVLIPHASPGGKAEAIARDVVNKGKPLFTFDDTENQTLIQLGAKPYDIDDVRRVINGANSK
jgi:predicted Rossmann fold nucleotide-binding protein DprA/Smf involved in DNA uptake